MYDYFIISKRLIKEMNPNTNELKYEDFRNLLQN